jgi:hypothetical protein
MAKKYRSPTARTGAAAAAPARLAEEFGDYALWRDRPDGELEVVTVREGCLYRHLVHENGTTSIIDYEFQRPGRRWATLSYAGFGFNLLILLGMATGQLSVGAFPLFLVGMAVMAVGTLADLHETDPAKGLGRNPATAGEWHEPSRLGGWTPQTSAQLAAVEQLANEHKGVARVRDDAGNTVDVLVRRWGRRARYVVDASGHVDRAEGASAGSGAPWREVRTMEEDRD